MYVCINIRVCLDKIINNLSRGDSDFVFQEMKWFYTRLSPCFTSTCNTILLTHQETSGGRVFIQSNICSHQTEKQMWSSKRPEPQKGFEPRTDLECDNMNLKKHYFKILSNIGTIIHLLLLLLLYCYYWYFLSRRQKTEFWSFCLISVLLTILTAWPFLKEVWFWCHFKNYSMLL